MAIMEKTLRRLLPNGQAWRLTGNVGELIDAFGLSLERAREFLENVQNEAIPGRATYLLEAWHETLGLAFDNTLTPHDQRMRVNSAYTSTGGSSLDYVVAQVKKEFPRVMIREPASPGMAYSVTGDVNTTRELVRLRGLIVRLVLLHLTPNYTIRILETLDSAYTGACITGKARCGRTISSL